jgi:sensor histidine kinase regulating citrate/malate metabolism
MSNQFKALRYKQDYETAQYRLQAQIAHYSELSAAEQELKAMRHDLKNELLALSGLLAANRTQEAAAYLARTEARIRATEDVVNTGYPAIDAIVNSKIKKARESSMAVHYKMLVETPLLIDPFDMAIILGNALDNAIEAVLTSTGVSTDIHAAVTGRSDYLSVLIENHASEPVDRELRTSKKDPANHGFGIRQMKMIAAKYDGDLTADFDEANHKFSLRILLRNQAAPEK